MEVKAPIEVSPVRTETCAAEIKRTLLPPLSKPTANFEMLSLAIRSSVARRTSATLTPMLGRGFSNVYSEGSVAQSRGFKSVSEISCKLVFHAVLLTPFVFL